MLGLAGHNPVVGARVAGRAVHLAEEEADEARSSAVALFEHAFLLVVDVKQVQLAGAIGEGPSQPGEQASHDHGPKGIKEKQHRGPGGKFEGRGIRLDDARGRAQATRLTPEGEVAAGDADQGGVELNTEDAAEGQLGCQQDSAAHAGTDVDECGVPEGSTRFSSLPAGDELVKHRRSHAEVCGSVAIVRMAGVKVPSGDEPAGTDAVFEIEGVGRKAFPGGEAGKAAGSAFRSHSLEGNGTGGPAVNRLIGTLRPHPPAKA